MGNNLTNQYISASFQGLVQISGSQLTDGTGSLIDSLNITASDATNATSATSASYSATATSASYAGTALSSSYALTASFAENVVPQDTGSLLVTASVVNATTTYTKGDGTTFNTTIDNVNTATSASYAATASFAANAGSSLLAISASHALVSDTAVSSSYATNASTAVSSSYATNASTATSASYATNSSTATSASYATNASTSVSSSYALTASYVEGAVVPNLQQVTDVGATTTNNMAVSGSGDKKFTVQKVSGVAAVIQATTTEAIFGTTGSLNSYNVRIKGGDQGASPSSRIHLDALNGVVIDSGSLDILSGDLNIDSRNIILENNLQALTTQSNNTSSVLISAQVSESLSFPINDNIAVFIGGTRAENDNFYTSQVTGSRNTLVYGVSQPSSYAGMVNLVNVSESVVLASNWAEMGSGFGYSGETRNAAIIASSGVIYGGVPQGGLYSTYLSYIYGNSNSRSNAAIFGGRSHTINQSYNSQIFGGQSNTIPNAYVDGNQIFGGDTNTVTGGSGNGIVLGIQNTVSAGNYNHIFGGSSNLISANSGHSNIVASYASTISSTNSFPNCEIIGGKSATITGNASDSSIIGGEGGTINGTSKGQLIGATYNSSIGSVGSMAAVVGTRSGTISGGDTQFMFGGQGNTISSGYVDCIVGGRENVIENRSTSNYGNIIVGSYISRIRGNSSGQNAILGGIANIIGTSTATNYSGSAIIAGRANSVLHNNSVILAGSGSLTTKDNEVVVPTLTVTGSIGSFEGGLMTMKPWTTLPSAASYPNTFAVSGSLPYFSDGSTWTSMI